MASPDRTRLRGPRRTTAPDAGRPLRSRPTALSPREEESRFRTDASGTCATRLVVRADAPQEHLSTFDVDASVGTADAVDGVLDVADALTNDDADTGDARERAATVAADGGH